MNAMRRLLIIAALLFALVLGLVGGVLLDRYGPALIAATGVVSLPLAAPGDSAAGQTPDYNLLTQVWKLIQAHYVDRAAIKAQELTYGAAAGMVNALGDTGHSTFLTPKQVTQERVYTQGSFEGIGALVEFKDGHADIAAPYDGSPAQKAGVHAGDIILKVNGQDMMGKTLDQVVAQVLGPAGTQVTLTLRDPKTEQSRDVTITRAHINLPSVEWQFLPGTKLAHVKVSAFSEHVVPDLQTALADAQKGGAIGFVLDLRNNPGGLLDASVDVASQFFKSGAVLQEKDAQGKVTTVAVNPKVPKTDLPMVVLINAGTASAAEIVSGALQDAGRASLVGETTFGTGTVLNQFPLPDGSAILLAVEEWLTPKGRTIWHQGIKPDYAVSLPAGANPLLPEAEKGMTAEQLKASDDAQLLKALDLLNSNAK
jgi:carboxyl-terminal processing protease